MSLINDALKRAREAQQENPPTAPDLEFRPVEPDQQPAARSPLLLVGLSLVTVAILGLTGVLVYFVSQPNAEVLSVRARPMDQPRTTVPSVETNPPTEPAANASAEPTLAPTLPAIVEHPDESNPNGVPVAVVSEALKPAPLKLQGIFFNPRQPSAVVNGRSVYLGDRVSGFRVMGISPVAVTLVSAAETNVLSLSGQ